MQKNAQKIIPYGVIAKKRRGIDQNAMLHVLPLLEARKLLLNICKNTTLSTERVRLSGSFGRVLARDAKAREDLPPFDRSAVDGFAVVSRDTFGASAALPALLRVAGEVKMGERARFSLEAGACAEVYTGGELPRGADAMAMVEETQALPGGLVAIECAAPPGKHVVFRGDDVRNGETALPAGRRIFARETGLLSALGINDIEVFARPRVKILSTGDELVSVDGVIRDGQMRDANGPMLQVACMEAGAEAEHLGIVPDIEEALLSAMRKAASDCDLLLLSGASSAGAKDVAARCLSTLGEVAFHGLALKPGKPTFGGRIGNTIVIGLPGHPAAAFLVYHELVRPLITALCGETRGERTLQATLLVAVPSNHGREELVPVRLADAGAEPVPMKSGLISPLSHADGYLRIPRDIEGLAKGACVDVILF